MPPQILREYRILFERVPEGEAAIDGNELGQRSKLGGSPNWVQTDQTPTCPRCGKEMRFVGQLDSLEHQNKANPHSIKALSRQQHFMFGDVGLIYLFFCFDCCATQAIFQCG